MEINKVIRNHYGVAMVLNNLGVLEEDLKRYSLAQTHYEACLALSRDINCYYLMAQALNNLAGLAVINQAYDAAQEYLAKSLLISLKQNLKGQVVSGLQHAARITYLSGQFARTTSIWSSVKKLSQEIGEPLDPCIQRTYEQGISTARETLDAQTFEAAWETGREMTLEEAVAYALS